MASNNQEVTGDDNTSPNHGIASFSSTTATGNITSDSTGIENSSSCHATWQNLTAWVQNKQQGGLVHSALHIIEGSTCNSTGDDQNYQMNDDNQSNRGVIARRPIAKGELLIRLPITSCVLSGQTLMSSSSSLLSSTTIIKTKSSWMQCVAAYYHAKTNAIANEKWKPY